jgi:hypothetical protein
MSGGSGLWCGIADRYSDDELTAAAGFALDPDFAIMSLHDTAYDGQPEAGAFFTTGRLNAGTAERFEEFGDFRLWNARAWSITRISKTFFFRWTISEMVVPDIENLIALEMRLSKTCVMRFGSISIGGKPGAIAFRSEWTSQRPDVWHFRRIY